ncbi:VOC family protein [Mucilaginibacter dorajii]|uniref:Glyoxalase/fosfomycin resistance/dioxygenase domain-containing protein n=1 Tax=Mucilaginibacter dorajii TaxID=692994 RepID=A0ABP7Q7S0_9SPHI|nr:VOC family protein [Mucilaginibacter dorajii]MCS3737486.1 catechol 2,3-dioxygenase-like lactoylglutathione lyase family enzyme [Mucilaginibacter dorajii]
MQTAYPKIKNMSPLFVVADLEQSIDFYTQKLGFEIDFRYEDFYAGITRDGFSIHLKSGYPANEERTSRHDNEHVNITFQYQVFITFLKRSKAGRSSSFRL